MKHATITITILFVLFQKNLECMQKSFLFLNQISKKFYRFPISPFYPPKINYFKKALEDNDKNNLEDYFYPNETKYPISNHFLPIAKMPNLLEKENSYTIEELGSLFFDLDKQNKKNIIVLMGPPGSGKSSIAQRCFRLLGWKHISTGNICRQYNSQKKSITKKIAQKIQSGELISDDIMKEIIDRTLKENFLKEKNIILDGYPRTANQVKHFYALTKNLKNVTITNVCLLAKESFIIEYATNREVCPTCHSTFITTKDSPSIPQKKGICDFCSSKLTKRSDDEIKTIAKRFKSYKKNENEILPYLKKIINVPISSTSENPLSKQFEQFENKINRNN